MNTQISQHAHSPAEEHKQDQTWRDITEEMIAGHGETARTITFRGKVDEVEAAIHSAQIALLRHRTRAVRDGRIRNYIWVIMKRGDRMMVFNRPVVEYHKYIHRAPPDVFERLDRIADRARGTYE